MRCNITRGVVGHAVTALRLAGRLAKWLRGACWRSCQPFLCHVFDRPSPVVGCVRTCRRNSWYTAVWRVVISAVAWWVWNRCGNTGSYVADPISLPKAIIT